MLWYRHIILSGYEIKTLVQTWSRCFGENKIWGTFVTIKFIRWFVKKRVWTSQPNFFTSKLFLVHSVLFDATSLEQNIFYIKDTIKNSFVNRLSLLCIIENLHVTINFTSLSSQEVYCWVSDYVIVVHLIPPLSCCLHVLPPTFSQKIKKKKSEMWVTINSAIIVDTLLQQKQKHCCFYSCCRHL